MPQPDTDPLAAALAALAKAYAETVATIDAAENPQAAFDAATQLSGYIHAMREDVPLVRGRQAHRIWKAEEITLAELGERLGNVSMQRAHQIVHAGQPPVPRKKRKRRRPPSDDAHDRAS